MIWIALKTKILTDHSLESTAKKDAHSNFCYLLEHELLTSSTAFPLRVSHQMHSTAITEVIGVVIVNGMCYVLVMK